MLFMGTEFGQRGEWDYRYGIDLHLLSDAGHRDLLHYTAALFNLYLETPALYALDFDEEGFSWLDVDNADENIVVFLRRDGSGGELIAAFSFAGADRYDYRLPVPALGTYDVLFFSGEEGAHYEKSFIAHDDGDGAHLMLRLPARTGLLLRRREGASTLTLSAQ
jgi:1,4-alpha-glucan branching enzyme